MRQHPCATEQQYMVEAIMPYAVAKHFNPTVPWGQSILIFIKQGNSGTYPFIKLWVILFCEGGS